MKAPRRPSKPRTRDFSRRAVALTSGGFDSAALMAWALSRYDQVFPLYVRQGHRWETAEIHWLRRWLRRVRRPALQPLTVRSLPVGDLYHNHWSRTGRHVPGRRSCDNAVYLPGRNLFLLTVGALQAQKVEAQDILMGTLRANPFLDAHPNFFKSMERSLSLGLGWTVKIRTPFRSFAKNEVARRYGYPHMTLTFSCLNPRGFKPCGQCNKCEEMSKIWYDHRR